MADEVAPDTDLMENALQDADTQAGDKPGEKGNENESEPELVGTMPDDEVDLGSLVEIDKSAEDKGAEKDTEAVKVTEKTYASALELGFTAEELTAFKEEGQLKAVVDRMTELAERAATPADKSDQGEDAASDEAPPGLKFEWPKNADELEDETNALQPDIHPTVKQHFSATEKAVNENRGLIGAVMEDVKKFHAFIKEADDKQWTTDADAFFAGLDVASFQALYGKGPYAELPLTSQERINRDKLAVKADTLLSLAKRVGERMSSQQAFEEAQFGVSGSKTIKAQTKAERLSARRRGGASMRHTPGDVSDTPAERSPEEVEAILG